MATTDAQRATTATTTQLAKIILLSERRVQQLVRAGVLRHAYDEDDGHELRGRFHAIPNIQNYIRYLREELGSEDVTETRFLDARSRRMAAMASAEELRLDVLRGKLHRAEDVEFFMSNRDSAIRARILAISSRITRILVGKTDPVEIRAIIDAETLAVLDELAAYDPTQFTQANEEYLSRLFPEQSATKPNGNGEGERVGDTEETDTE
jgi:phage terminase Nu1 subunit (DNA packaging protein)